MKTCGIKSLVRLLTSVSSIRWARAVLLAVAGLLALPAAHSAMNVDSGNGTVQDTTTGLQWDQCPYGRTDATCSTGTRFLGTWSSALNTVVAANTANYKGYSDWRLPNRNELESIVKLDTYTVGQAAIDTTAFPGTPTTGGVGNTGAFWSSTTYAFGTTAAWEVSFKFGTSSNPNKESFNNFIRLVRSGQSLAAFDSLLIAQSALALTSVSGTYGSALTLTATGGSGTGALSYVVSTAGTAGCSISGGDTLNATAAGTCTVTATKAADATYSDVSSAATTVTFAPIAQTITGFSPASPVVFGAAAATLSATGGASGNAVTFATNSAANICTVLGSTVTFTGVGVCNLTADQAGNSNYAAAAQVTASITIDPASQTITFTNPGARSFGTTPTLTATASSGLTVSFTSSTTGVCTITTGGLLSFVTSGSCTINADQAGNGTYQAAAQGSQTFTVNAVVPGAPTIGTATAGAGSASVAFTAPSSNGGAAITGYTVTSNPGGITGTGASSPITVSGLTNGVAYTFTVTAANSAGPGSASAASNSVTPKASQIITFSNPGAQSFGTTPTLTASSSAGGGYTVSFSSATTGVCTITTGGALTFVTAGSCTINADQAGDGTYQAAPQVSWTFTVNAVVPGAPTIGTATAGDTQASVAFTAPTNTGGAAITGYTVTSTPGGLTGTGASSPITVSGLTNGQAYTFTVTATNSAGTGSASAASNSVTPKASQTITFATPGGQNFGTTPTLTATASSGLTVSFTSSTTGVCTITTGGLLSFVTSGSCTINADQAGNGTYQAAAQGSQTFTVNAVAPGAPTIGTATAGVASATVTFTAPASNGGSAITGYTVTSNPGGFTGTGASSPITVSGLTNGQAYTFTITATNSAGPGSPSAASNSVTPKASQTITFSNPGAQSFGTTPTLTASSSAGGGYPVSFTSATAGVCTITTGGVLTFVTTGNCTINADQAGDGSTQAAPQVSQTFNVNAVAPGVPTSVVATAGDAQATVSWTAPAGNGGAAITGYRVQVATSSGGVYADAAGTCTFSMTGVSTAVTCTATGLTNGTQYFFKVAAVNSVGTGSYSTASLGVTPAAPVINGACGTSHSTSLVTSAPSANLCATGTVGNSGFSVIAYTWSCVGSNGGSTASCSASRGYTVTPSAGSNGSISPSGAQLVAGLATPAFTATPAADYAVNAWAGSCNGTASGTGNVNYTTSAVTGNCTVSVSFTGNDSTPDAFSFIPANAVALSTQQTPNTITVAGINTGAAISITGGEYQIGSGAFTSTAGTVNNGDTVTVRHTSSAAFSTATTTTLTIGGVSADFVSTTLAPTLVNGTCGSSANVATAFLPAANLCSAGTASTVTPGTSSWAWSCSGTGTGATNATCSAPYPPVTIGGGTVGAVQTPGTNGWQINQDASGFVALPAPAPAGVTFPGGATKVVLITGTAGTSTTVTLRFSSIPAGAQLYKYGKENGIGDTDKWFAYPATIDVAAGTVTYTLTDGQRGDNDWTANSVIDDPVGLGVAGGAGIAGVPTLSQWAMMLLAGLMALATFLTLRRRTV